MVEKLLHANIVLSKQQLETLRSTTARSLDKDYIGTITFLGTDNIRGDTVHFLIRFGRGCYLEPMTPTLLHELFGEQCSVLGYMGSVEEHVLVTTKLKSPLRCPLWFFRSTAKRFARAIVNWYLENDLSDQEKEDLVSLDEDEYGYLRWC